MECVVLGGPGSFFKSVLVLQYEFCLSTYHSPLSFSYLSILSHFPFVDIAIINVCYLHILCLLLYLSWKHWIFPLFFALFSAVRVPLLQQVFSSLFFSLLFFSLWGGHFTTKFISVCYHRLWAPKTGKCKHVFEGSTGHEGMVTCIAGSEDGDLILTGDSKNSTNTKYLLIESYV